VTSWDKSGAIAGERLNYLYGERELEDIAPNIGNLASKTQQLHVLFNNCYDDNAVFNAHQMKRMVGPVTANANEYIY
jgi:uncharacterized protein YecE (DUF72 family)